MLQHGRLEKYSSTVQFIFCTCSPRRQPRDNTGQVTFSLENCSLLLSSLQDQQKAMGFPPSGWGKTEGAPTQLRHLALRWMQKGLFATLFPFLQRYVLLSSIYMNSAVLTPPSNFFYGCQKDIYWGGHSCIWVFDCCYTKIVLCFLCPSLSCCSAPVCWQYPFKGRKRSRKGMDFSAELGRIFIWV